MTAISWKNAESNNWNLAANWSTNTVPTLTDDVTIAATGTFDYVVSITSAAVAKTLTFSAANAELLENAGSLRTTGSLTVNSGLVVLNRANTLGAVSLVGGVLSVGNAGALGTAGVNMSGGELVGTITETLTNSVNLSVGSQPSIAAMHGTTLNIGSGGWGEDNDALSANFGDPGYDGTVVLHVPSISASGGTGGAKSEVRAGTLVAGDANAGEFLNNLTVDSGATFDLAGSSVLLGSLQGSGTVKNTGAAATLTLDDFSGTTFTGSITGAISLVIDGSNTQTILTGANTYTGTTNINFSSGGAGSGTDGVLVIGTGGSIGSGAVDDENHLIADSASAITLGNVISGAGSFTQEGTGTTTINNANNSYAGGTNITAGTLAVGNVNALASGQINLSGGELLSTVNENLLNAIAMSGSFTIAAAHGTTLEFGSNGWGFNEVLGNTVTFGAPGQDGTVIWDSANIGTDGGVAFSGTAVEVRSGTLKAGDTDLGFQLHFSPRTTVDAGATLDIGDFNQGLNAGYAVRDLTGTGTVTGANRSFGTGDSGGYLILNGANFAGTFTGGLGLEIQTSSTFSGFTQDISVLNMDSLATLTNTGTFNLHGGDDIQALNSTIQSTTSFVNDGIFNHIGQAIDVGGASSFIESNFVNNGTLNVLYGNMQFDDGLTNNGIVNGINSQLDGGTLVVSATATYNAADFNSDGASDILFRNDATGDTGFYAIVNGVNTGWHDVGASSTAYKVVGSGDYDGTGTSDVAFRNAATGDTGYYSIENGANTGWTDIGLTSTAYSVVASGYFDGGAAGDSYMLFRNNATGDTGFYVYSDQHSTFFWIDIGATSTAYSVVGTGNFDGNNDILFRNNATGDTGFYSIVDGANTGWHDIGASSTAYSVVGIGNFLGNGTDDVLYRNNATGDTGFYAIVGGVNQGWHDIGTSSTAYSVVGTGDYLGNGTSDVLFRNNSTGDTGFYAISGGVNTGWHDVGVSSTAYHVVG
jgi:autotransporter-associated beta strand protein